MARALPLIPAILAISFAIATDAAAQGRGRPKGPKTTPQQTTTGASQQSSAGVDAVTAAAGGAASFRQFGAWLDDASAPAPHEGRTGIGFGYWRLSGGSQMNAPTFDVGYGLTDRLQVSASVPFYHTSFAGATYRGLDDVYISGKYTLLDPTLTESEFGLAVSPVVEVLSAGAPDGRLHVGFPVSVELRRLPFRVYGSAGYFSRGSLFTGGAVEWTASSGMVLTGALVQSYSLKDDVTLDALDIGQQRVDVMGGVGYPLGRTAAAYASVSRSLTSIDEGGTILSFSVGLSFRFAAAKATP